METARNINISLSSELFKKIENYEKCYKITAEEVIYMALDEFFDMGFLLEDKQRRKKIWDIIEVPEDC